MLSRFADLHLSNNHVAFTRSRRSVDIGFMTRVVPSSGHNAYIRSSSSRGSRTDLRVYFTVFTRTTRGMRNRCTSCISSSWPLLEKKALLHTFRNELILLDTSQPRGNKAGKTSEAHICVVSSDRRGKYNYVNIHILYTTTRSL